MNKSEDVRFDLMKHELVPKHVLLSEEKKKDVVERYGPLELLPKISADDPAIQQLGAKPGDLIKIMRSDAKVPHYRVVGQS